MAKSRILVVEDEEDILELVRYNLSKEGYTVETVTSGEDALKSASAAPPDLVLLDHMLPGLDGIEVCRAIKADLKTRGVPIIMMTAKGEESDIISGLEVGADDYVVKPFSPKVLIARVRAVLRRMLLVTVDDTTPIKIHNVTIHPGRHEVLVDGKTAKLSYTEFKILHFLARKPGWVFTRYQIVDAIHGSLYTVTDRAVDVQIVGLRKKLGRAGKYIETVRGVGYRFKE